MQTTPELTVAKIEQYYEGARSYREVTVLTATIKFLLDTIREEGAINSLLKLAKEDAQAENDSLRQKIENLESANDFLCDQLTSVKTELAIAKVLDKHKDEAIVNLTNLIKRLA